MVTPVLRDFRPSDQRARRRLILEGLRDRRGEAFDASVNPDLRDFVANYLECGAEIVVFESDGEIIAAGIVVADDGATGWIMRMSVSAVHRRQGLARGVVEELTRRASLTRDERIDEWVGRSIGLLIATEVGSHEVNGARRSRCFGRNDALRWRVTGSPRKHQARYGRACECNN